MLPDLILVHGIYATDKAGAALGSARAERLARIGESIGVCDYEWVDGRGKKLANRLLQRSRGTAQAVDSIEIIRLNESAARDSLADSSLRSRWSETLGCATHGLDAKRSFLMIGSPLQQVQGPATGQRLLWLGRGLEQLTEQAFIDHYTGHHGPLVASYAKSLGIRRYMQVPNEQHRLCEAMRELGLGEANAPAVFAELFMGIPPVRPSDFGERRMAKKKIAADEGRHIDFSRSMILLV